MQIEDLVIATTIDTKGAIHINSDVEFDDKNNGVSADDWMYNPGN